MHVPVDWKMMTAVSVLAALAPVGLAGEGELVNPSPRQVTGADRLRAWDFSKGVDGWQAVHECSVTAEGGRLRIVSTGTDPYLHCPAQSPGGSLLVRLRARCKGAGDGQFFWVTDRDGQWDQSKSRHFKLTHDGQWHDYEVPMDVVGEMRQIRLDPGTAPGEVEIERMELFRRHLHPLEIVRLSATGQAVRVGVRNHGAAAVAFTCGGQAVTAQPGQMAEVTLRAAATAPFEEMTVEVASAGLPTLSRKVRLYHPSARAKWLERTSGGLTLRAAADGSGACLLRGGAVAAVLSPLVSRDGQAVPLELTETPEGLRLTGRGMTGLLAWRDGELAVSIGCDGPCEGPALRVIGALEQGLFAGLEYLGKGERSSSTLDIETDEHIRFAPDPIKVTMPLMACVTDRGTVAITWKDMTLRPTFASPNFLNGTDDHLMSLAGRRIEATVLVGEAAPIEEAILWAVRKHGLPPLPSPPRTVRRQWDLCLACLNGPVKGEGGWGHCAEPKWPRQPYASFASTIWRLTGQAPELPRLTGGGSHVRNDAAWFATGRARQWLAMRSAAAKANIAAQKADGSFRYEGPYRRGHFEDTASGHCARPALELLEHAWYTGDREALAAGLKALEFMKRFQTPRGAQTWEVSLHTPDILASAYLVGAYVRGCQLTGQAEHLAQARRWALSGVPFVYLWGDKPVMTYATVPVYGATNWRAPNWIGLPVQWCGGVYAYWLTALAPLDKTLDWHRLAEGILIAAEQMQYPDGAKVGCLPDVFRLEDQRRDGPSINPCALVSLRQAVAGEVDSLAVAVDGGHRVVAPFPVTIRQGKAHVQARPGATYQVLIDGRTVVDVESKGTDTIEVGE